ncbi:hypothetical protein EUGRSUZ_A00691 [Eucalyptus grandis]|uniref:non-specific serine/threonine protein kinase n=4 Tax=Eucalyptus grandis TaxID=71139 RepID=A0A059DCV5_EUCGR|nr:hypothetical protein EUGRSUZ_A00691 [Eucalyptus grandis]KAK3444866.1 hypothetical protein EUGRSUZ_A00691 [Eucalyptus grandis]KAK3444867.1 hypothetical protein EUGRSUZ_A00691 [Eucalyptus grandis]
MENGGGVLMDRYELGRLLGQGAFAKVYQARNISTGMEVAIKMINKEYVLKVGMRDQIKREIQVMKLIRHPHVVELYEVMATKTKIYLVMEFAKGGELFNKVAKGKLKEDVARRYFRQLIAAVDYCHSRGVFHRDLKPENLLLDENGNLKVSDFGLSALAESKHEDGLLHTTCGTEAYVAPEVINRRGYNGSKADIWSCGVILYVLLAGRLPFFDTNRVQMLLKIVKGEVKFPEWFARDVCRLLLKILDPNPNRRISMTKIMESSWFRKGLDSRNICIVREVKEPPPLDADELFGPDEGENSITESKQEPSRLSNLNAFDIISYSPVLDLSGLFVGVDQRKEVRFMVNKPASTIISKLEDIAKRLRLKVTKKDAGLMKFEGMKAGRKGVLAFDAEIFEIIQAFHWVEMKKSSGDTMEYQKVLKEEIRPALQDIVLTWQGG